MGHRWRSTALGAALAITVVGCGQVGIDDPVASVGTGTEAASAPAPAPTSTSASAPTTSTPTATAPDEAPRPSREDAIAGDTVVADPDDAGPGFGGVTGGAVAVTGDIAASWTHDLDGVSLATAGGCPGGRFGALIGVSDEEPRTVARVLVGLGEDLRGGTTGTWPTDDLRVELIDGSNGLEPIIYDGEGTLEVVVHDAPADRGTRRMSLRVTGEGLEGDDGAVDLDAAVDWVMGCP